jgi:DNA polymerase-3 subunit gamma/tau
VSQALYRTYRSKSLEEVVGQRHITDVLSRAIKNGRISHAYLLTGPKGVGKTSVARILAHEINNLPYDDDTTHLDIIEIDAASNNGVEDIRDLREKVQLAPVSAKKKVYIIDEVHMLSKAAFNALLKTLEEPPEHVVFILATTDADKLPATIISRTQRFGFRAITQADAVAHLRHIADAEKIKISDDALALIARRGDGSFRDSISLLDQLSSITDANEEISHDLIETALGLAPDSLVEALIEAADRHDITALLQRLDEASATGIGATIITDQLIHALRHKVIEHSKFIPLMDSLLDVAKSSQPDMKLFTVLGSFNVRTAPKVAALTAAVPEVVAPIASLAKKAVQPKPAEPAAPKKPAPKVFNNVQPEQVPAVAPGPKGTKTQEFEWTNLIEHTRKEYVALYSVLSKCQFVLENDVITLYTVNAFYKKKLDDPKYSTHLYDSLAAVGCGHLTIETIPERLPLKDSQAAAVAAIMGGGEEVVAGEGDA